MVFFIKKQKIKLEAYAPMKDLIDLFPVTKAKEHLPSWFKQLPNNDTNLKHCTGFKDLFNEGLIIPNWAEYVINISQTDINVTCSTNHQGVGAIVHDIKKQATGSWPDYANVKLHSPWYFYCSEPIKWVWTQPMWNQKNPEEYLTVPGITEFKHQNQTNVNLIIKVPETPKRIILKAGDPLAHLFPLTDRDWELDLKVMSNDDWVNKFAKWTHSFDLVYQKSRIIKERNKNEDTNSR